MHKSFYAAQSIYSDPGAYREILKRSGTDPRSIGRWICSIMQHPRGPESKERGMKPEQVADLRLRSVAEILSVVERRGLIEEVRGEDKVGGLCRDFAILAASRFRDLGIPARLRVGFADYIVPDHWEDHWLCEWHDGLRWRRLDVEFAAAEDVSFDASDVPHDRFLTASEAWFLVKKVPELASRFGVSSLGLAGEWFVAGSLFREIAALRRLELKPWDYWGLAESLTRFSAEWPQQARIKLDQLAIHLGSLNWNGHDAPRDSVEWTLPQRVVSFPEGEAVLVVLLGA